MNLVRTVGFFILLFIVVACSQSEVSLEPQAVSKKFIDLSGYAHPNVTFLQKNLTRMEANSPFDGIIFRVDPLYGFDSERTPTLLEQEAWNVNTLDFDVLANMPWAKFRNNFIRLDALVGETEPDWFSNTRWNQISANMKLFAKIAKTSKSKGIAFDNEPYGFNPWDYSAKEYPGKTFKQVYEQVRKRGAQVMRAWQSEYPNITILNLFGLGIVRAQTEYYGGDQSKAEWGLWGAFIEGMLDVINPQARLIEGNEGSYYYTSSTDFSDFREYKRGARALLSSENRITYDQQMQIAYAVYVDNVLNLWKSPSYFGYYLASDLERRRYAAHNFYHAMKNSDEYVWVYAENMDWWGTKGQGVNVPSRLPGIMQSVKNKIASGQSLSFSITQAVEKATFEFDRRVFVDGYIYKNGLDFNTRIRSGPPIGIEKEDSSCNTYNNHPDYWYYDCTFPYGWTGTLTPSDSDVGFTPAKRSYTNLTQSSSEQNFDAKP
jgi:hypothetical protein